MILVFLNLRNLILKLVEVLREKKLVGDEFIKKLSLNLNLAIEIKELSNNSPELYDYINVTL